MAYSPTTWVDGVTSADAAKLNNIESGVVVANAGVPFQIASGQYLTSRYVGGGGTSSQGTNFMRAVPVEVPVLTTVVGIGCSVSSGTASSVCRLGIYSDNGYPNALLVDAGTVDCSTSGDKEASISSLVLTGGRYWLIGCMQGAATTMYDATGIVTVPGYPTQGNATGNGGSGLGGFYNSAGGVTGALPSTFTSPNANVPNGLIRVYIKVA